MFQNKWDEQRIAMSLSLKEMRPSPEAMLKVAQTEEQGGERGKMKISLGYAAGIGKTYTMLEAARQQQENREWVWHVLRSISATSVINSKKMHHGPAIS